ncbi:hypothetical protein B0H19DRAFT_1133071 [Mycena capillaripes]|nr:hypothetical protein B0H19DRAFT_1133071 [Mycena capillaripes]
MTRHSALELSGTWPKAWLSAVPATSWDTPHCELPELVEMMETSRPAKGGLQVRLRSRPFAAASHDLEMRRRMVGRAAAEKSILKW